MARFSWSKSRFFKWALAVAADINAVYNDIVSHANNSLMQDSIEPSSIDTMHFSKAQTIDLVGGALRPAYSAGSPIVEIDYVPSGTKYTVVCTGHVYPRSSAGWVDPDTGATLPNEVFDIGYYDSTTASWILPGAHRQIGSDQGFGHTRGYDVVPIGSTTPYDPLVRLGGGRCVVVSRVFTYEYLSSLSRTITKVGLFGNCAHANYEVAGDLHVMVEEA